MVEAITLVNTSSGKSLNINMDDSLYYVLDSCYWGQVKGDVETVKYVNQVGKIVVAKTVSERDIKITGWVVADENGLMTTLKSFLNSFVNPLQEMNLVYKDKYLTFVPDTSVKYETKYEDNNDTIAKFTINGTCYDPLWKDSNGSKVVAAEIVSAFHFPLKFHELPKNAPEVIFGSIVANTVFEVENKGDITSGFMVVFTAKKGDVFAPYVKDVNSGKTLSISTSMRLGESMTVSTVIGHRWIKSGVEDTDGKSMFKYLGRNSSWLQLKPGTNLLSFGAASGADNLDCYLVFNNRYLEVQECY